MGPKHSHHESKEKKSNNNNSHKPAVFINDDDPLLKKGFGIILSARPVMPEAVPPLSLPAQPPPTRPSALNFPPKAEKPPVPPPRSQSNFAPPVPAHINPVTNFNRHPSATSSKSNPVCPPRPQSDTNDRKGSVQCMHGDPNEDKLLIVESRFIAQTPGEISVEEGDLLYLIAQSNSEWWYVSNKNRQFKGHVPKSHVVFAEVHEPWFAGNISSILAEQRVMQPGLPIGTFLIRENIKRGTFVLTVRTSNSESPMVYVIYRRPHHGGFEMRDANGHVIITFGSLLQLVNHFKSDGQICTKLTKAAPPLTEPSEYVTMRKWQVDRNEVKQVKKIGGGEFGEVYLAKWRQYDVAVKTLRADRVDQLAVTQFLEEAKTLTKLSHQNVICLLAVCATDQPFLIITEYMKNGSLLTWLQKLSKTLPSVHLMSNATAKKNLLIGASISAQVAAGMDYLSANQIVHRDLAARNVVVGEVSSNGVPLVKVADFGLARKVDKTDNNYSTKTENPMPWRWMAPEAFNDQKYNTKTDVWSYGILLWEIGTMGETPYRGLDTEGTLEKLAKGEHLHKPALVPDYVYEDAFLPCVDLDPNKRPTFDRLFKYFDDINFDSLFTTKRTPRK